MDQLPETKLLPRVRGIYILPNLFTIAALFAGFYAIVSSMLGRYENAVLALFTAIILDGLDGRIARMTHSESDFGAQLDSLSDMISFGLAPSLMLYTWSLSAIGKAGWLAAFIYTACTGLRLARFNTQLGKPNKRYFQGLSTTACASFVGSLVWVCTVYDVNGASVALPMAVVTILLGLFKVSSIRYRSFKDLNLKDKVPFVGILGMLFILVLIAFDPPHVLLLITGGYVVSGPVGSLISFYRHWRYKSLRAARKVSTDVFNPRLAKKKFSGPKDAA